MFYHFFCYTNISFTLDYVQATVTTTIMTTANITIPPTGWHSRQGWAGRHDDEHQRGLRREWDATRLEPGYVFLIYFCSNYFFTIDYGLVCAQAGYKTTNGQGWDGRGRKWTTTGLNGRLVKNVRHLFVVFFERTHASCANTRETMMRGTEIYY